MPRITVIQSVFQRNFSSYFSGVLGYVFIVAFVMAGAALAFNGQFFAANEPNLDQLSEWFPLLLLFIIPAITMTSWAEEKRAGTDELLFTLPASDLEIVLGKFFAVLAVYTVVLLFSASHILVLMRLGVPDWGLIITTYLGYWLAGAALLSAGMLASALTTNTALAFVLGVVMCGIPVFIDRIGGLFDNAIDFLFSGVPGFTSWLKLGDWLEPFSLSEQFRDFSLGIVPLSGIVYFVGFTMLMLFINAVLVGRRHWRSSQRFSAGLQFLIRVACVGVVLTCATAWAGFSAMRVDATSERLFSLDTSTRSILNELESERPIEIQAFISPSVPREYVDTRKRLVGLLRQFDELGGPNLEVRYVDVEPFSKQADEAERFGIESQRIATERDGRSSFEDVFLGAVVISSYDKVTIPFFGKGLPIEYELTRSVQTVANKQRYTVGILQTDVPLTGGSEWQIVTELKKQYNVVDVSSSSPITGDNFDVLLAAMPSSLTDNQMNHLVDYVKSGEPALIFDDPFPIAFNNGMGITNAPKQPKSQQNPMGMMGRQQPPPAKADDGRALRLTRALGINWEYDQVVFDANDPHPRFGFLPDEYVFVTRDNNSGAFSDSHPATKGLQEMITLYAGTVSKSSLDQRGIDFEPLIVTSGESGLLAWNDFVDEGGFNIFSMQRSAQPRENPIRRIDPFAHVIAAQIKLDSDQDKLNAIYVADLDMIADVFFQERSLGQLGVKFDNVSFVLNAVDALAGDETYISLRSRRAKHRTLKRIDDQKKVFLEEANEAEKVAEKEANDDLEKRRLEFGKRVKEIQDNVSLDRIAKTQLLQQAQEAEQSRLSLAEKQIEQRKNEAIEKIRARNNRQNRAVESQERALAVWLSPVPPLLMGLIVFLQQWFNEKKTVSQSRRRDSKKK